MKRVTQRRKRPDWADQWNPVNAPERDHPCRIRVVFVEETEEERLAREAKNAQIRERHARDREIRRQRERDQLEGVVW